MAIDLQAFLIKEVFDLLEPKLWVDEHWIYRYKNSSGRIVTAEVPATIRSKIFGQAY